MPAKVILIVSAELIVYY